MNSVSLPLIHLAGFGIIASANPLPVPLGDPPPEGESLHFHRLLGDPAFKHADSLTHVQPIGGDKLLSASEDGSARIWDIASGKELARFSHGSDDVWNAIPLPGEKVATAADSVCIWDAATGEQLRCMKHDEDAFRLAVIPNTTHLASGHDNKVILIRDWETGETIRELSYEKDEVYTLVAPAENRLIASGDDGVVQLWDLDSGEELEKLELEEENRVSTISLSPDRKHILVSSGKDLHCLRCEGLEKVWSTDVGGTSYVSAWSPDGSRAALCSGSQLLVIKTEDGAPAWRVDLPHGSHRAVAYSPGGEHIFSGGDKMVYRFAAEDGEQLFPKAGERFARGIGSAAALSADGSRAFLGSLDRAVYPFDTDTGKARTPWPSGHTVDVLELTPDGGHLVAAGDHGSLTLFGASKGDPVKDFDIQPFDGLAVGAEGYLVTVGDDGARRWMDGKMLGALAHAAGEDETDAEYVDISSDGRQVATAAEESDHVKLWSVADGALRRTVSAEAVDSPDHVRLFPDGRGLAIADDETLHVWFEPDPKPLEGDAGDLVRRHLEALSSDRFADRERARQALLEFGPGVIPLVEDRVAGTLDARIQLAQVLHQLRALLSGVLVEVASFDRAITDFAGSPDGLHWAATVGYGHATKLVFGSYQRDPARLQILQTFSTPNAPRRVVFSADGKRLLTGNRNATLCLYELK